MGDEGSKERAWVVHHFNREKGTPRIEGTFLHIAYSGCELSKKDITELHSLSEAPVAKRMRKMRTMPSEMR